MYENHHAYVSQTQFRVVLSYKTLLHEEISNKLRALPAYLKKKKADC